MNLPIEYTNLLPLINKLILGTAQLGLPYGINNLTGQPTSDEAFFLLDAAYKHGIRYVDTAEAYGKAHEIIGDYHRRTSVNKFSVITKCNSKSDFSSNAAFIDHVLEDLQTLNIDSLEAYLFHSFDSYKNFQYWDALTQLVSKKYINKIGISVYTNEECLIAGNDQRITVVQLPFNLLDNLHLRGNILMNLRDKKKEIHIRSVFLQGLFYKDRNNLGSLASLKKSLLQIDTIAQNNKISIGAVALAYCLRQPLIDKVLIGVDTERQLLENIQFSFEANYIDENVLSAINQIRVDNTRLLNPSNW